MKYDMTTPCKMCPFRRGTQMLLRRERIIEIEGAVNQHNGANFPCHETVEYIDHECDAECDADCDGTRVTSDSKHCAGALIYLEQHGVTTQMMRIAERLKDENGEPYYDHTKLASADLVWDNVKEWLAGGVG